MYMEFHLETTDAKGGVFLEWAARLQLLQKSKVEEDCCEVALIV